MGKCSECSGTGKIVCPVCGGSGRDPRKANEDKTLVPNRCSYCSGTGKKTCNYCGGSGQD